VTRYIVLPTLVVFALGLGAGWALRGGRSTPRAAVPWPTLTGDVTIPSPSQPLMSSGGVRTLKVRRLDLKDVAPSLVRVDEPSDVTPSPPGLTVSSAVLSYAHAAADPFVIPEVARPPTTRKRRPPPWHVIDRATYPGAPPASWCGADDTLVKHGEWYGCRAPNGAIWHVGN
jgi:hypothetical protein